MKFDLRYILIIIIFGLVFIPVVFAAPTGPSTINVISSSRYTPFAAANISAIAGNVTEINFNANTITNTWQGYFGNITGSIVLGNSNNQTLYNWNLSSPTGEIYATRNSDVPAWGSIACANQVQINSEDTLLGVNQTIDQDSVNITFINSTPFDSFFVGSININSTQNCRAVNLYNGTGASSEDFQEVLLHDGTAMVYTAIITQDSLGFDNRTHDFQMLVGEDGHRGNSDPIPYYFYLELQ
ncbi:MAG: hypothetical protein ACP5N1_04065 [Candidatus Woesearchaeota archaeon]